MILDLIQNSFDGLAMGAAYALLAVGFTLVFGVLRRVNLSYGPAIMVGCYAATWVSLDFHANIFLLLAASPSLGSMLAGAYVEKPLLRAAPAGFGDRGDGGELRAVDAVRGSGDAGDAEAPVRLPADVRRRAARVRAVAPAPRSAGHARLRDRHLRRAAVPAYPLALRARGARRDRCAGRRAARRHRRAARPAAGVPARLRDRRPRRLAHRFHLHPGDADARHVVDAQGPAGDDDRRPGLAARRHRRRRRARPGGSPQPVVPRARRRGT